MRLGTDQGFLSCGSGWTVRLYTAPNAAYYYWIISVWVGLTDKQDRFPFNANSGDETVNNTTIIRFSWNSCLGLNLLLLVRVGG